MKTRKFVGLRIVKNSNDGVSVNDLKWAGMINSARRAKRTWYLDRYGKVLFTLNIKGQIIDILPVAWLEERGLEYQKMMLINIETVASRGLPLRCKSGDIFGDDCDRLILCSDTWQERAVYHYSFKDEACKLITRQFTCEASDDAEFGKLVRTRLKMISDMHPGTPSLSALLLERSEDDIYEHPSGIRINPVYIGYAAIE